MAGVLACLSSYSLRTKLDLTNLTCYTFGAPRPGSFVVFNFFSLGDFEVVISREFSRSGIAYILQVNQGKIITDQSQFNFHLQIYAAV